MSPTNLQKRIFWFDSRAKLAISAEGDVMRLNEWHLLDFVREPGGNFGLSSLERRCQSVFACSFQRIKLSPNKQIMSKRKQTPQKQIKKTSGVLSAVEMFRRANSTMHDIRVSTPILVVVQRLTTDAKFREDVTRLFSK